MTISTEAVEQNDRQPTRFLVTAPLILAYLIVDDLWVLEHIIGVSLGWTTRLSPPARCAMTRLPQNLASSPLAKQLYSLMASTSERKYNNVYSRALELRNSVSQPDFFDTSLGALLGLLIDSFLGRLTILLTIVQYTMMFEAFGFMRERTLQCRKLSQLPSGGLLRQFDPLSLILLFLFEFLSMAAFSLVPFQRRSAPEHSIFCRKRIRPSPSLLPKCTSGCPPTPFSLVRRYPLVPTCV
jgi:hypothetical protein